MKTPKTRRFFSGTTGHFGAGECYVNLKIAPATSRRPMDVTLFTVKWQCPLKYLHGVVVFSKSQSQHSQQASIVSTLKKSSGLTLIVRKCFFFTFSNAYLRHTVWPGTLELATKTTDAIRGFKPPTNICKLRPFLNLCNIEMIQLDDRYSTLSLREQVPGRLGCVSSIVDLRVKSLSTSLDKDDPVQSNSKKGARHQPT